MAIFGAHMSVAGGLHKAIESAVALKMATVQIFTSSPSQWKAKPLEQSVIDAWQQSWAASKLVHPIAHASYLINLAAPDALFQKSVDALVEQWQRCETLGLEGLVVHPGAFTSSNEQDGIARIADGVVEAIQRVKPKCCRLLLENTAGQGTCLGHQISQLSAMFKLASKQSRTVKRSLGVCIDTCHAFAAGYAIHQSAGLRDFCQELSDLLPTDAVRAVHLNDSKKPLGSRVDRHEHIGRGHLGADAFQRIVRGSTLGTIPGYLETEKGIDPESGDDWDKINFAKLQTLASIGSNRNVS